MTTPKSACTPSLTDACSSTKQVKGKPFDPAGHLNKVLMRPLLVLQPHLVTLTITGTRSPADKSMPRLGMVQAVTCSTLAQHQMRP